MYFFSKFWLVTDFPATVSVRFWMDNMRRLEKNRIREREDKNERKSPSYTEKKF